MDNFPPYFSRYNLTLRVLTDFLHCNGLCHSIYSLIFSMYRISKYKVKGNFSQNINNFLKIEKQ